MGQYLIIAENAWKSIFHKVFKFFFLNSSNDALDLTKYVRLFQMSVLLKYTEFLTYTVDFPDGSDREGPFLRLYTFLLLK